MRAAVIVFPGSNCDRDAAVALTKIVGRAPAMIWHRDTELPKLDLIVVPGGVSYGDYLRSGAMAARSPVMREVIKRAEAGVAVLGICNGFQILTEAGLLPGALMRNAALKFICRPVHLRVETTATAFTRRYKKGQVVTFPIAHGEGNYFAAPEVMKRLEGEDRVAFRYTSPDGRIDPAHNPNGSLGAIAGILNERRNVLGLMPHPERASDPLLGFGGTGAAMFEGLIEAVAA